MRNHLRRYWRLHAAALTLIGVGLLVAFLAGAFAAATLYNVHGQKLDKNGLQLYRGIVANNVEKGRGEQLPPELAQKVAVAAAAAKTINDQVAAGLGNLHPLATPEPVTFTSIVRNQSVRPTSCKVAVWIVHDAEMPSPPGLQGLHAIAGWFNNPGAQASSNYATDAAGNSVLMVRTTAKAWTQAYFNCWSISDELLGYASQKVWPDAQLRAAAQLAARDVRLYKIPLQHGLVHGCTIVRPGFLQHNDLGACGGGHHDAGPHFPIDRFIALVKEYAAAGRPRPKPKPVLVSPTVLRAKTGEWEWIAWRFAQAAWRGYTHADPKVRPHVAATVPAAWWRDAALHAGAH